MGSQLKPNAQQKLNLKSYWVEFCRSGEEQSHKSPTPGGPDEYRRAVKSILIYLENTSGIWRQH